MEWTIENLDYWYKKIEEIALEFGLNTFQNEIEIHGERDMLDNMAYAGLLSSYPHWSFGKHYEKKRTMYDYGVEGLPYEMVINSNPCLSFLMSNNTLLLQILTMAHACFGHNDFFKNNIFFSKTRPEMILEMSKLRADRVRGYMEDPSIGLEKVEKVLDVAHTLMFHRSRDILIKKLSEEEKRQKALKRFHEENVSKEFSELSIKRNSKKPDLNKIPFEPTQDLLLFFCEYGRLIEDWEKDLLMIVDETAQYFLPQIETKIMNEGWASFWHHRILNKMNLPQNLHIEFLKTHSGIVRPLIGGLNEYYLGFKIFEDIEKRWNNREKIFQVRSTDRDASFLRQYLTPKLIEELNLVEFMFQPINNGNGDWVISEIADEEGCKKIRETLIRDVGTNSMPVIKVVDGNWSGQGILFLEHEYDGRELDIEYTEKTLSHIYFLWRKRVILRTIHDGKLWEFKVDGSKMDFNPVNGKNKKR